MYQPSPQEEPKHMSTFTWVGGGSNLASDPKDWSPNHSPQAGDTLIVNPNAVINISGNALHGDTLSLNGNFNRAPSTYTFNVSGNANFSVSDGGSTPGYGEATVDLATNANWVGGLNIGPYGKGAMVEGNGTVDNTFSFIDNVV